MESGEHRGEGVFSSAGSMPAEFWCLAAPKLLFSPSELKRIQPQTLRALHAKNREGFWRFVCSPVVRCRCLCWCVRERERERLTDTERDRERDTERDTVSDTARKQAFLFFRQSDVTVFPLVALQVAFSILFLTTINAVVEQFVRNEFSYITIAALAGACLLGWLVTVIYCNYALRGRRSYLPANEEAEKSTANGGEAPITENGKTAKSEHTLSEEDIVEQALLFRKERVFPQWFFYLKLFWICSVMLSLGLFLLCFSVYVDANINLPEPISAERHRISDAAVDLILFLPSIAYLVLRTLSFEEALLMWTLGAAFNVTIISVFNFYKSWPAFGTYLCITLFSLIALHRQDWVAFVLATDLRLALIENTLNSEEMKSNELKHMLGNIAHDMKTPMSSIVAGLELLSSLTLELQEQLQGQSLAHLKSKVKAISDLVSSLEHTNSLITMAINRSLDYHRTMHGQQLVSHNEVVALESGVLTPVRCVQGLGMPVNVDIVFDPPDLAKEALWTDKLWLHDNLLCLIGNAIKYSQQRPVSVVISRLFAFPDRLFGREGGFSSLTRGKVRPERKAETNVIQRSRKPKQKESEDEEKAEAQTPFDEQQARQMILFEVFDRGPGLSGEKKDASSLFGEPSQVSRTTGGSGLGLFSLAQRMSTLGGHYGMYPREDVRPGSCFWFSIPVCYHPPEEDRDSLKEVEEVKNREEEVKEGGITSTAQNDEEPVVHIERPSTGVFLASVGDVPSASALQFAPVKTRSSSSKTISTSQKLTKDSMCVLVVDDSAVITRMVSMLLKKQGYQVWTAENGLKAVQLIQQVFVRDTHFDGIVTEGKESGLLKEYATMEEEECPLPERFDVILMDFQMPVMNGIEAIRLIRSLEKEFAQRVCTLPLEELSHEITAHRHTIIGFSAKSDPDEIREALDVGMDAFMPKPFTMNSFHETLKSKDV